MTVENSNNTIVDELASYKQLAIIQRFETFINYMYPILENCPRKHSVVKDKFLLAIFNQVELFIVAGKSNQISKLYSADANLSLLRFWLRFVSLPNLKIITPNQHRIALEHIVEVGKMLGSWAKNYKNSRG